MSIIALSILLATFIYLYAEAKAMELELVAGLFFILSGLDLFMLFLLIFAEK